MDPKIKQEQTGSTTAPSSSGSSSANMGGLTPPRCGNLKHKGWLSKPLSDFQDAINMVKEGLELGYAALKDADNAVLEQEKDYIELEQELDEVREERDTYKDRNEMLKDIIARKDREIGRLAELLAQAEQLGRKRHIMEM